VPGQSRRIGLPKNFVSYAIAIISSRQEHHLRRLGLDDKQLIRRNVLSRISWAKESQCWIRRKSICSRGPIEDGKDCAHFRGLPARRLLKANRLDANDLLLAAMPCSFVGARCAKILQPHSITF